MTKTGRKTILDIDKRREILAILAVGCSRRTAARYVNCAVSTIQNTADRDPDFAAAVARAEKQCEIMLLHRVQKAAKQDQYWRAAAWLLERMNPEDFAPRGPDTLTGAQIAQILARLGTILVENIPLPQIRKQLIRKVNGLAISLALPSPDTDTDHDNEP